LLLAGVLSALVVVGRATAQEKTPEAQLKDKGLRRVGQYFALPVEGELNKKSREADAMRKKIFDAQQKLTAAEKRVEEKKKTIVDYTQKRRQLRLQLDRAPTVETHNRIVEASNELGDRLVLMMQSDDEEKAVETAASGLASVSEQYVESLLSLRAQYEEAKALYAKLAADEEVKRLIEEHNATSEKKCQLGPMSSFRLLDRNLKKLEDRVLTESIDLRRGGGNLWHVTITFNGKFSQDIAIDTGASVIALPYKVAAAAGLTPSAKDPTVHVSLADGHVVEAKRIVIAKVRLGKFTVENVECAVMPSDLPDAEPLLGLSFFKHFVFKIDSAKGKLIMSSIDQSGKNVHKPGGRAKASDPVVKSLPPAAATSSPSPARDLDKLARLLKPKEEGEQSGPSLPMDGGKSLAFRPSKNGRAATLRQRFGEPDKIIKINKVDTFPDGEEKSEAWEVWNWGKVHVMVDAGGTARFYAVAEK